MITAQRVWRGSPLYWLCHLQIACINECVREHLYCAIMHWIAGANFQIYKGRKLFRRVYLRKKKNRLALCMWNLRWLLLLCVSFSFSIRRRWAHLALSQDLNVLLINMGQGQLKRKRAPPSTCIRFSLCLDSLLKNKCLFPTKRWKKTHPNISPSFG